MKKLLIISCLCLVLITVLLIYQFLYVPWKTEQNIQKNKELVKRFRACVWARFEDRVNRKMGFLGETPEKDEAITEEVCNGCMTEVGLAPSEEIYDLYFSIRDEFKEEIKMRVLRDSINM